MSLVLIKTELERLCYDVQGETPEDAIPRIEVLYKRVIHDPVWIEKNAQFRVRASGALFNAKTKWMKGDYREAVGLINEAQGALENAVQIDVEERMKGVPKPLQIGGKFDSFSDWLDEVGIEESEDEWVVSGELYDNYVDWVQDEEPLSPTGFGKRMSQEGFEKRVKKVDGKTVNVWMVRFVE